MSRRKISSFFSTIKSKSKIGVSYFQQDTQTGGSNKDKSSSKANCQEIREVRGAHRVNQSFEKVREDSGSDSSSQKEPANRVIPGEVH